MTFDKTLRETTHKWSAWVTTCLLLMLASQTFANGKIYQVEMIVFERGTHSSANDAEGWQKNVQLSYTQNWRQLVDPDEEASRQAQAAQEDSLRLSDDFLQTLAEERGQHEQNLPAAEVAEQSAAPAGPSYFEYLPDESRGLQKTREALVRRNHYRILFHETWLQPMTAADKSPALVLHGGRQYGHHYELQGYINLSVSRFLHIQTELWLSEFSVNHGQDIGYWPPLPLEPHMADARHQLGLEHNLSETSVNLTTQESQLQAAENQWYAGDTDSPYLVNNISTLSQKRRMRSGELHYLDHPRFGVLIKITPQQN